jgi:hypothetical protein
MSETNLFLIADFPGFTPQVGRLVSMMNYVRFTTVSAAAGLISGHVLDYYLDRLQQVRARTRPSSAARRRVARKPLTNEQWTGSEQLFQMVPCLES